MRHRVRVEEIYRSLGRKVLVGVAHQHNEHAALQQNLGDELHLQVCSLRLIQHHHLGIGSAEPVTRNEDFVSTTYSTASGAARPRRAAVCSKNDTAAMLDYYLYLCFHVTAIPQCGQEPPPARVATMLTTGPVVHMGAPCH